MIDIQTILTYLTLISVPVGVLYNIMTLNARAQICAIKTCIYIILIYLEGK